MNAKVLSLAGIVLLLALACAAEPGADETGGAVEITEWLVPYEKTRPRDPFVDPKGRVWFCGQGGAYLAYMIPATGEFKKYDLADGAGPHNLVIDSAGAVWFAANTLPYIGRLDPETGEVKKFAMPAPVKDPHTLVFDSAGDIWFTAQRSNYVAKLDTRTGEVKPVAVPVPQARPYGIKIDANDRPWIVLFGTNKLATVDPETLQMEIFDLPRESARPRRLEITNDGMIWYVDYAGGMLGRFDRQDHSVAEWPLPGGAKARPYGTALDDKNVIWMAEGGAPNRLVSFDTKTEQFSSVTELPKSGGAVRHMYFHPPTREIWFGEDTNYLGRARLP